MFSLLFGGPGDLLHEAFGYMPDIKLMVDVMIHCVT